MVGVRAEVGAGLGVPAVTVVDRPAWHVRGRALRGPYTLPRSLVLAALLVTPARRGRYAAEGERPSVGA